MGTATASGTSSRSLPIILGIIGIIAIIVGVLYFVGSGLPHFMIAGSHVKSGHHLARGGVALGIGVLLLIGAWITGRPKAAR